MGLLHHPFWLQLELALSDHHSQLLNYFVWPRITDEGSLPDMRIWFILLIESELKWCIHLSRSKIEVPRDVSFYVNRSKIEVPRDVFF